MLGGNISLSKENILRESLKGSGQCCRGDDIFFGTTFKAFLLPTVSSPSIGELWSHFKIQGMDEPRQRHRHSCNKITDRNLFHFSPVRRRCFSIYTQSFLCEKSRGEGNTNNWTWDLSIFFLRGPIGVGGTQKGYGISGTAFGTEWGRGCTSVDASVRNACPWGVAISISPLPLASPSRITSSTSVRSAAYQQRTARIVQT